MWGDLTEPSRVCLEEARAAYRAGSVPDGAVLVDAQGRILTRARNRRKPIRIVPPESADFELVVTGLHTEFGLRYGPRYAPNTQEPVWLEAWRSVLPDGVRLGEAVFRSGWLARLADIGAPVRDVIDGLAKLDRL